MKVLGYLVGAAIALSVLQAALGAIFASLLAAAILLLLIRPKETLAVLFSLLCLAAFAAYPGYGLLLIAFVCIAGMVGRP